MAMTKQTHKNDYIILSTLDELVLEEHLVRKIENCIDFRFIEELVTELYKILIENFLFLFYNKHRCDESEEYMMDFFREVMVGENN